MTREDGTRELHRASDMAKDQSYVLGVLDERQLAHAMFPLGDTLTTKDEIRAEAERRGLAVAKKPDSHDICFIADGDTQGFLARRASARPRATSSTSRARSSARHEGAYGFTIGQRKGLRIGAPGPGRQAALRPGHLARWTTPSRSARPRRSTSPRLTAIKPRWCGAAPTGPGTYTAQLRAHGGETRGAPPSWSTATSCRSRFTEPVRGVAPGQAIVLYDGTRVVGSATIATTERARAAGSTSGVNHA